MKTDNNLNAMAESDIENAFLSFAFSNRPCDTHEGKITPSTDPTAFDW